MPWIAVDDLGAIAVRVFADPDKYVGRDLTLASALKTMRCVIFYQEVLGKKAPHFPMPLFMFRMFTGEDLIIMWKYLRHITLDITPEPLMKSCPKPRRYAGGWPSRNEELSDSIFFVQR